VQDKDAEKGDQQVEADGVAKGGAQTTN